MFHVAIYGFRNGYANICKGLAVAKAETKADASRCNHLTIDQLLLC
jgi:hypothetical protein